MKIGNTKYSEGGHVRLTNYEADNSPAILILDDNGQVQIKATTLLNDDIASEGCVFLKGWSENEGVIQALVNAGVVELTGRKVRAGYSFALEGRLLVNAKGEKI